MAKFFTDFDEYPVGDVNTSGQTEWTPRISNGTSDYRILDGGDADGKFLRVASQGGNNGSRVISYNPLNGVGDNLETLVKFWIFKSGADGSSGRFGAAYTRYGGNSEASTIGYAASFVPVSSTKSLALYEDATGVVQFQNYAWSMSTDYFIRTRLSGTLRQVKIWRADQAEPAAWTFQSNATPPTIASPYSGVGTFAADSFLYVKQFSAGTNGDTAPMTKQEYINTTVPSSTPMVGLGGGYGGVGGYGVGYGEAIRPGVTTVDANQPGSAMIQRISSVEQSANARLQRSELKTQVGNAAILQGILRDQNAVARIQRIISADQTGVSRIQKSITQSVIGNARIRIFVIRNQLANSAILRIPEQHQPARGMVAKEMTVVQPGGAFIIRVNDYQNPPRIGIRPQIGGQPSMVDGRGVTDINVARSRTGRVAERPRTSVVNTRPRARQ